MGKLHDDGICIKQQDAAISNHWLEAELCRKREGGYFEYSIHRNVLQNSAVVFFI